ncbi:hypothetical protein BH10BAC2_BH10BAC2_42780 [soil metagenome]
MRNFAFVLMLGSLLFASCQKEDTYPPLGNNSGTLLIKSVSVANGETTTTTYAYTTDGKIDVINMTGTSGGISVGNYRKFYRDATGRIISIAEKVSPQSGIEVDTVFTYVHYPNATTFNYDYTVQNINVDVYEINDSTLITYNSNNQITQGYTYQTSTIFGPFQEIKTLYTYDAVGNVIKIEGYNDASGTMELSITLNIAYDDKTNPLAFDQQASLLSGRGFTASVNNPILIKFTDAASPGIQTITNTYTFRADGLPETLLSADDVDGTVANTTTTFYYQ